jgi:hypothetical protein
MLLPQNSIDEVDALARHMLAQHPEIVAIVELVDHALAPVRTY